MDIDEDNTQRPRAVTDYGIEVDFDMLDDEDREVVTVSYARRPFLRRFVEWLGRARRTIRQGNCREEC
jgi:hypothetical protein